MSYQKMWQIELLLDQELNGVKKEKNVIIFFLI